MTEDDLFSYDPMDPEAEEHEKQFGKCPSCGAQYTVIPGLELIYKEMKPVQVVMIG